ncbi:MAG: hypothetical protein V4692_08305, partial [Bdellovibrionota bacterium]
VLTPAQKLRQECIANGVKVEDLKDFNGKTSAFDQHGLRCLAGLVEGFFKDGAAGFLKGIASLFQKSVWVDLYRSFKNGTLLPKLAKGYLRMFAQHFDHKECYNAKKYEQMVCQFAGHVGFDGMMFIVSGGVGMTKTALALPSALANKIASGMTKVKGAPAVAAAAKAPKLTRAQAKAVKAFEKAPMAPPAPKAAPSVVTNTEPKMTFRAGQKPKVTVPAYANLTPDQVAAQTTRAADLSTTARAAHMTAQAKAARAGAPAPVKVPAPAAKPAGATATDVAASSGAASGKAKPLSFTSAEPPVSKTFTNAQKAQAAAALEAVPMAAAKVKTPVAASSEGVARDLGAAQRARAGKPDPVVIERSAPPAPAVAAETAKPAAAAAPAEVAVAKAPGAGKGNIDSAFNKWADDLDAAPAVKPVVADAPPAPAVAAASSQPEVAAASAAASGDAPLSMAIRGSGNPVTKSKPAKPAKAAKAAKTQPAPVAAVAAPLAAAAAPQAVAKVTIGSRVAGAARTAQTRATLKVVKTFNATRGATFLAAQKTSKFLRNPIVRTATVSIYVGRMMTVPSPERAAWLLQEEKRLEAEYENAQKNYVSPISTENVKAEAKVKMETVSDDLVSLDAAAVEANRLAAEQDSAEAVPAAPQELEIVY